MEIERISQELLRKFGRDDEKLEGLSLLVTIESPDGTKNTYDHENVLKGISIDNPKLWWPNGYGEQPLYTVTVDLLKKNSSNVTDESSESGSISENMGILDSWTRRIGLRTMTMHIEKDAYGECFCHEINGVRIFAMGADYIPEDNILARVTPERTYELLLQARNAHHNCVRVWGGGNYPYDAFWDACDELGLIVWEDFMFACAVYNLTEEFEENITAEFIDNIKRIRHHASLGLWCGNNEMEMFVLERDG